MLATIMLSKLVFLLIKLFLFYLLTMVKPNPVLEMQDRGNGAIEKNETNSRDCDPRNMTINKNHS